MTLIPKMNVNKLFLSIFVILFTSCDRRESIKGDDDQSMSYAEFIDNVKVGEGSMRVLSILGDPDEIIKSGSRETWEYGPDIEGITTGGSESVVGVSVTFDETNKIINISATRN